MRPVAGNIYVCNIFQERTPSIGCASSTYILVTRNIRDVAIGLQWQPTLTEDIAGSSQSKMDKYRHDLESQSSLRSILNLPSNVSNTTLSYKNSSVDHLALSLLRPYSNFILIGTGWVFNTMALVVFLRTRLKKTTFGHYLCALAIADNLVLTGELFISLGSPVVGINVIHKYDVICRLTYCIRYAARLWSAVLVTLITIERYYFIVHPLKMTHLHTTFAAKLIICTSFLASCLMSLYAVFLVHVEYSPTIQRSTCVIRHDCLLVFSICDLVVSRVLADFITGFLILTFTLFIACHLVKVNKTRRSLQVHICPQSPQRELQVCGLGYFLSRMLKDLSLLPTNSSTLEIPVMVS